MAPSRVALEPCTIGYQKTFYIEIHDHAGAPFNLTAYTLTAKAVKPDGSTYTTPTTGKLDQTAAATLGQMTALNTSTDLDTAGTWKLDVYAAASGGNAEPITRRFKFEVQAKETEA